MQHLEGSGTPVLYIGRTVLRGSWYPKVRYSIQNNPPRGPLLTYLNPLRIIINISLHRVKYYPVIYQTILLFRQFLPSKHTTET
jgi:hypothetical protein